MDVFIERIADAWASIDGKLEQFRKGRDGAENDKYLETYEGYCEDAKELMERMNKRGLMVNPTRDLSNDGYFDENG